MIRIFTLFRELDFDKLASVYGLDTADRFDEYQDFCDYLRNNFFAIPGGFYAVWEENGRYACAVRAEYYRDGFLIAGLETKPDLRNQGYAKKLLHATFEAGMIPRGLPVYAHIHKKNAASIAVHTACGFVRKLEHAVFIDGSYYQSHCTMVK